jgi:hypothetical protein
VDGLTFPEEVGECATDEKTRASHQLVIGTALTMTLKGTYQTQRLPLRQDLGLDWLRWKFQLHSPTSALAMACRSRSIPATRSSASSFFATPYQLQGGEGHLKGSLFLRLCRVPTSGLRDPFFGALSPRYIKWVILARLSTGMWVVGYCAEIAAG